jgi:hypothetical protein
MGKKKWQVELSNGATVFVSSHEFEVEGGALAFFNMMNDEQFYVAAYGATAWYSCSEAQ